jgi:phosphatidylglycerol:prolipoprotein diacylglycerol transferase
MNAVITIPFDPVFQLGPIPIHWYGVGYAVAFLVGIQIVTPFLTRRGIREKDVTDLFWWNIVIGLLGARLYYVVQQPLGPYLGNPLRIIALWEGGMAFFGALIACLVTTMVLCYRRRLPAWLVLDAGAIFATLPQAIGRIGNIINGDILGGPSDLPWATRYTSPSTFAGRIGVAYQPAGAYELLISLFLFALVILVIHRGAPVGTGGIVYIAGYAVSQFLIFFVRATEPTLVFGLKQAQLTAIVILFILVPILVYLRRRFPRAWVDADPAS